MPVSSYGASTDSLAAPSLSSWAASVSAALDGSDTTVNTRITQRVLPLTAKTGNYTLTASDEVVTCNGTLTITLPTAVGLTGKQFIIRNIATSTVTIARTSSQTIDGCSGTITLAGKGSLAVVSDGANWLVVSGQYTDESVGRRIFTWSSALANGATTGWQMTYGDTGWRDVSSLLVNGFTGSVYLRRIINIIWWKFSISAAGKTASTMLTIPAEYRCASGSRAVYNSGGNLAMWNEDSTSWQFASGAAVTSYFFQTSALCDLSWPSSLPGTASGSIPT